MKFLKKKKEDSIPEPPMDHLEEPPAPPGLDVPEEPPQPTLPPVVHDEHPDLPPVAREESAELPPEPEHHDLPEFPEIEPGYEEQQIEHEPEPMEEPPEEQPTFETQPELPEMEEETEPVHYETTEISGPLFIRSNNFQKILGRINTTKHLLKSFEDKIYALNELDNKEDKKYSLWKVKLEDIQRKLIYVDKVLFER